MAAAVDQTQLSFACDGLQVWQSMSNNDPQQLQQLSPARYNWMLANVGTEAR